MMKISTVTHDYIANELTAPPVKDVVEAAYLRLSTEKGSYFTDPNFGSELYRVRRGKDTPRLRLQAIKWAQQALDPLKARYFLSNIIVTEIQPPQNGQIRLLVQLIHQNGQYYTVNYTVKVAG